MGLREEKKLKTRKAISDLATKLFIDRGYCNVTTAEIAQIAQVSIPTLFKYFPTKEMLVFDEDSEIERWLIDAVTKRKKGQNIVDGLLTAGLNRIDDIPASHRENAKTFMNLVDETPELSHYASQMWLRHEKSLANAIKKESKKKITPVEAESIARFVLDSFYRSMRTAKPKETLKTVFQVLRNGWSG